MVVTINFYNPHQCLGWTCKVWQASVAAGSKQQASRGKEGKMLGYSGFGQNHLEQGC